MFEIDGACDDGVATIDEVYTDESACTDAGYVWKPFSFFSTRRIFAAVAARRLPNDHHHSHGHQKHVENLSQRSDFETNRERALWARRQRRIAALRPPGLRTDRYPERQH